MSGAVSPQVVERWILESANPHNPQSQLQATHDLQRFFSSSSENAQHQNTPRVATLLLSLLTSSNHETVVFCAMSELARLGQKDKGGLNAQERTQLLHLLLSSNSTSLTRFFSLRNKSAFFLATLILQGKWENFQSELTALASYNPTLFLLTLETMLDLMVTVSSDEAPVRIVIASVDLDAVRRMRGLLKAGASERFCETILALLSNSTTTSPDLAVAALKTIKGIFLVDLPSLSIPTINRLLEFFLLSLQPHRDATLQLAALEAWGEWIHSTAAVHTTTSPSIAANDKSNLLVDDRNLEILGALLEKVHEYNLLPVSGESNAEIEVVIEIAKLVCNAGLHLLPTWSDQPDTNPVLQARFNQILDLFFRAFAYDDIDVSSAVIPVAAGLVKTVDRNDARLQRHMPQLLNILYNQLKYPPDYNQQNDDDAEEQVYRTELCKLYAKIVRDHSAMCLQFMCEASNQWLNDTSKPAKQDVEATLRLIFQYSEGLLPSPGIKTAMKDATFCALIVALHTSDFVSRYADVRNILCLYYEVSVRYSAIFLDTPNTPLLSPLLGALSGAHGLQHSDGRLRSRCCFLLLRLVTALSTLLRPYVETAVSGIQNLLAQSQSHPDFLLRDEDSMYLFETMGILVGKTGVDESLQVQYLSTMLTSHVKAMDEAIQRPDRQPDVHRHGENLASSISAMAHLSKGFSKQPSAGVKTILVETMSATARVLESIPSSEAVRNKSMVLFQRMILCLGPEVLQFFPRVLFPLIAHCTAEDILFVSQLFNQLCIKFKQNAVPAIDGALLSFLQKCHSVIPLVDADLASGLPPHLRTEQWSIQKLAYAVLLAIVSNQATAVLLSTRNVGSLEMILRTMSDGAVHVRDGVIQRTCIRFFRELVEQWGAPTPSGAANDVVYQRGFMTFTVQVFIGGMLETLLDPVFNPLDANQARCMTEFSHVLHGCLLYDPTGTLTALAPLNATSEFRLTTNAEQVDRLLRQLVLGRRDTRPS